MKYARLALSVLAASFSAGFSVGFLGAVGMLLQHLLFPESLSQPLEQTVEVACGIILMTSVLGQIYALPASLLLGVPVHYLLARRRLDLWFHYLTAGGLAGLVCIVGWILFHYHPGEVSLVKLVMTIVSLGFVPGITAATVFWWLFVRQAERFQR